MNFRQLIVIGLLSVSSVPATAAELWTDIYHERLTKAQQGSADAQFDIGAMYENGRGVTADREQAMQWYRKAADQGHSRAAHALVRMQDNERRLSKTQSQAESGDVESQYTLGTMYLTGTGTPADLKLAEHWLKLAADKGHTKAQFKLGHLHYVELAEDGDMKTAFDWFTKAAASNYPPAFYYLGDMYATGSGVTRNYAKARDWYEQAKAAGFSPAVQALSELDERVRQDAARRTAAATAAAAATENAAKPAPQPETSTVTAKSEPEPAPQQDSLDRLMQTRWQNGRRPVQFLPSKVSECNPANDSLVCYSRELARKDLPQVHYKVKSIIRTAANDAFKVVYRELVLQDITDYGTGADAELLQETGIPPGWQEPHSLNCKFTASQRLTCIQDNGPSVEYIGE